ncbi:hypothetical protein BDR26DRAFT_1005434 [Obelidium mucronatum]|nr:hypothetical protein BDR26DRAFT_1005434 [Obelidium mucronatum]
MACIVTLPSNALSATGLSTPWTVTGCDQTKTPTFAECVAVNKQGMIGVYSPLIVNEGAKPNVDFLPPTPLTLPTDAVVGCWFGTNGDITQLADKSKGADLKAANCVNGKPNAPQDLFGQFAACNAVAFFALANKKVTPPPLGTGKNNLPCYTTRSFQIIDMDPSDNVVTAYLQAGNIMAQKNKDNIAKLAAKNNGNPPDEVLNGSDNLLLNALYRPALGCVPYTAKNLAAPKDNTEIGALALNEIQARLQSEPQALVPPNDPMVVLTANGTFDVTKQNAYRASVNQPPSVNVEAEKTAFCQNMLDIQASGFITDLKFLIGQPTPDAGNGKDLFTFLGARFQSSWMGLGCNNLVKLGTDATGKPILEPITANRDANGVTQSLTFNTPKLQALLAANGGNVSEAQGGGGLTPSTPTPTATDGGAAAATTTPNAGTPTQNSITTVTITVAPTISVVVVTV